MGLIAGSGRSPGEGNGNPLQYSCHGKSHGQKSLVGYSPWGRQRVWHNWATKQQQQNTFVNTSFPVPLLNPDILQSCLPHPLCRTESQLFTKPFWRTYCMPAFGPGDAKINETEVLSRGRRLIQVQGLMWRGRGQWVKAQGRPSWDRRVEGTFQNTWSSITSSRKFHPPAVPCSKLSLCWNW